MQKTFRQTFALFVLAFAAMNANAQHYIGMHKDRIAPVLRAQNPDFRQDLSAVNNTYHYLKFVDDISDQTILFFLSEEDVCIYVRWMSDYANLTDVKALLNRNYRKSGENLWNYSEGGKRVAVMLEQGEWYFTVNINPE